ncbi:MAG: TetR/AcrR family transcriptional regulator [Pseudolysinimonas sp.]|uniref:TetR/AcrR family transcriptional regulator n=1 Tax=Pseudolysinimonas sp. TaxID=2680009 RepID=UPI0032667910
MVDPRIARTRQSLEEALFALARERELDAISVADITERAGVNRSSFYQHYADKDTLLADAIDAAAEEAGADLPMPFELTVAPPAVLVHYLKHIEENADVYRRMFAAHGSGVAVDRLRSRIEVIARSGIDGAPVPLADGIPHDVLAAGLAGSVLAVIQVWVARDPRPPAETAAMWVWQVLLGPALTQQAAALSAQRTLNAPSTPKGGPTARS